MPRRAAGRVHLWLTFVGSWAVEWLRNDLGLLFLVTIDSHGRVSLTAVPLALDCCHTRLANPDETAWPRERFTADCAALGTEIRLSTEDPFEVSVR
jgi:hypothetical protein